MVTRWVPHELTDEDRMKRVEDFCQNLKLFQEGKWQLCDVVTGDDSCFFLKTNWQKERKTLHGLKVSMRNQWFTVASLSQKSWSAFFLNQQASSKYLSRKRSDYMLELILEIVLDHWFLL